MVVAEKWAEQRVLMRAYADSRDQTRPTIMLHGQELGVGPAGVDRNGPWGIHVGEDHGGRAQEVKAMLEEAARRVSGSRGNPPRLADEEPTFDRETTANWGPGAPRILPQRPDLRDTAVDRVAPVAASRVPQQLSATQVQTVPSAQHYPATSSQAQAGSIAPSNPGIRVTPMPRRHTRTAQQQPLVRTALGYSSGSGAQSAVVRLGLAPHVSAQLGRLVERIVPADFHIDARERRALNALGEAPAMTARALGQLLDVADAVTFMEHLVRKLELYGLGDLLEPGEPVGNEPTYRMRR